MPTLRRYLSIRFLASFAGALAILASAVLVVDLLLHIEEVLEAKGGLPGAVSLLLLRAATLYLPYLIPVATFLAAFLTVGLAARAHEMLAIKASGISPLRALVPIFAGAALISAASLLLGETLGVGAAGALQRRSAEDRGALYRGAGGLWYYRGRFIYRVVSADEDQNLEQVRVFERDESGRLLRLIEAERAVRVAPAQWRFLDASVREFDAARPSAAPRYRVVSELDVEIADDPLAHLRSDLSAVRLEDLLPAVGDDRYGVRVRSVLHQRLASPLNALLFALLAVPLGLRVERVRNLALPAAQGVLLLFLFLTAGEYGSTLGMGNARAAIFTPWLILASFTAYGLWRLSRVER